jgi:hypothetical protein
MGMEGLPAQYLPKLTVRQINDLRSACLKVDQVGQVIGGTQLQAKSLILTNLAEVYQVMQGLIENMERRALAYRRAHNLLTPEDLAADEAAANSTPGDQSIAEEG